MNPDGNVSPAAAISGHAKRIDLSVQETLNRLWDHALEVGLDDGYKYQTLRNAIAWIEVLRHG